MKKILTCATLSMVLLSGCSFMQANDGIIKVNDKTITKAEFDKNFDKEINASMFKNFGGSKNFVKSNDNFMYVIYKDKVVNELIVKSLLDEEIEKRGIKVTDEDIKNEMKTIIDKVGSKEELNKLLKQRGVSNSDFSEDLKTQIRIKKLVSSLSNIKISDNDAQKYYNTHLDEFKHSEQVRASHILLSADTLQIIRDLKEKNKNISTSEMNKKIDEITAEKKAKAEEILKEAKTNPDNFAQLAQKYSDDKVSGQRGGELGFFSKSDMVPEFSKAAFSMKPNTISDSLVKTNYGFHIIKVTDRMEAGTTPFVKVKDEIKFYLETKEQIKTLKNLTDGLMKTAKIEYIDADFKPSKDIQKQLKDAIEQK